MYHRLISTPLITSGAQQPGRKQGETVNIFLSFVLLFLILISSDFFICEVIQRDHFFALFKVKEANKLLLVQPPIFSN